MLPGGLQPSFGASGLVQAELENLSGDQGLDVSNTNPDLHLDALDGDAESRMGGRHGTGQWHSSLVDRIGPCVRAMAARAGSLDILQPDETMRIANDHVLLPLFAQIARAISSAFASSSGTVNWRDQDRLQKAPITRR